MLSNSQRCGVATFFVLAVVFLSCLQTIQYPITTFLKPLPIVALMVIVFMAPLPKQSKSFLIAALVMSCIGDIVLTLPLSRQLDLGLFSFLLAHLCYIALYKRVLKQIEDYEITPHNFYLAIGFAFLYTAIFLSYLWPFLGEKMVPVLVYMGVILTMALLAIRVHQFCAIGAVLFVISDSIIAIDEFILHNQVHGLAIMVTYYLAQWFLVIGLLKVLSSIKLFAQPDIDLNATVESA